VISGFLIAESYARAPSWQDFLIARVLRLWPGLLASLALVAFVMGPVVTGLPISAYLTSGETWTFMFDNILLFDPAYTLPGVFTEPAIFVSRRVDLDAVLRGRLLRRPLFRGHLRNFVSQLDDVSPDRGVRVAADRGRGD